MSKQGVNVGSSDDVGVVITFFHPEVEIYARDTIRMIRSWLENSAEVVGKDVHIFGSRDAVKVDT